MNSKLAKEQRRNLKNTIGETATAAVADVRQIVDHIALQHKVLAKQMLDFERTVAIVKEARATDAKQVFDKLEELRANISAERTHRLELADQQRAYVDGGDRDTRQAVDRIVRFAVERLQRFERMSLWARLRWAFTGYTPTTVRPATDEEVQQSAARMMAKHGTSMRQLAKSDAAAPAYPGDGV
jgi:hypothetical protein